MSASGTPCLLLITILGTYDLYHLNQNSFARGCVSGSSFDIITCSTPTPPFCYLSTLTYDWVGGWITMKGCLSRNDLLSSKWAPGCSAINHISTRWTFQDMGGGRRASKLSYLTGWTSWSTQPPLDTYSPIGGRMVVSYATDMMKETTI